MTAEKDELRAAEPRPGSDRDRWLREKATSAPRPLRIFFVAELGYRAWAPDAFAGARRRAASGAASFKAHFSTVAVVAADGSVRQRTMLSLSPPAQLRLARRLLVATATVGALATATSANLRTTGETLVFERLASGGADQAEVLAALQGTEAARTIKGVASDLSTGGPPATAPAGTDGAAAAAPDASASADAAAEAAAATASDRTIPALRGALPVGKGMWIWLADKVEGGNPEAIVARAQSVGLTHLIVRTASLSQGFYAGPFLDRLLPLAHAANIRVYAWDFPYLDNVDGDVARAVQAITYLTPDGHRVDGYVADIELKSMGVNVTSATAKQFGETLRRAVGPNYPLIACVPRPNPSLTGYPFAEVVASFDAIAPMVYWLHGDPVRQVANALRDLGAYGKPVLPVGQAYDAGTEGGPAGVPPREQLIRFMQTGDQLGASGVSWWSWQHADQEAWDAIRDAAEFRLPVGHPVNYTVGQVYAYQTLLHSLGFATPVNGNWGAETTAALTAYQQAARLPVTGVVDEATRQLLLTPFAPPIQPQG